MTENENHTLNLLVERFNRLQEAYCVMHNDVILKRDAEVLAMKDMVIAHLARIEKIITETLIEKFEASIHKMVEEKSLNKLFENNLEQLYLMAQYSGNRLREMQKTLERALEERTIKIHVAVDEVETRKLVEEKKKRRKR